MLAALLAGVELLLGFGPGHFLARRRAELDAFMTYRPWTALGLALAWLASTPRPHVREAGALTLLAAVATAGPALFLVANGARIADVAVQSLAGAGMIAAALALAVVIGRWAGRGGGLLITAAAGLFLLAAPWPWAPVPLFDRAFSRPAGFAYRPPERPALALITGLPLIWGEADAPAVLAGADAAAPAAVYRYLTTQFRVAPASIDDLGPYDLLLLAQPRPPGPHGLVAIDAWVRGGGQALILDDPDLDWPSARPLGDPLRPPRVTGLAPLFAHWRDECRPAGNFPAIVECRVGAGRALVLADADLLHDRQWVGMGRDGVGRRYRTADTPLRIAGLLDRLAGREAVALAREAADGIAWLPGNPRWRALLAWPAGFFLLGLGLVVARVHAPSYPQDRGVGRAGADDKRGEGE